MPHIDNQKIDLYAAGVILLPQSSEKSSQLSKSARLTMITIVVALALVAIFANVQRLRRDKVETVIINRAISPSPSAP